MKYLLQILSSVIIVFLALSSKTRNSDQIGWVKKKEYINENRDKKRMG